MSVHYNSKIVTDGLVLCLDAANRKSYPGSGTTWFDLSGNDKHTTLFNGPTYTTNSIGSFIFDRSNDYATLQNTYSVNSLPTGSAARTLISCFKTSTLSSQPYEHIMHYGNQAGDQAYGITLFRLNNQTWISNHTWAGTSYMADYAVAANTIYWVAISYNNNNTPRNRFFVNGSFANTVLFGQGKTVDYQINTGSNFQMNIGTRIGPAEYFGGEIYFCLAYNRELSTAEIQQNFNATRGRYGI